MTITQMRLKQARERKGYTQEDVAKILNISQQAYQKLEASKPPKDMRMSTIKRLCKYLEISSDWLLAIEEGEGESCLEK